MKLVLKVRRLAKIVPVGGQNKKNHNQNLLWICWKILELTHLVEVYVVMCPTFNLTGFSAGLVMLLGVLAARTEDCQLLLLARRLQYHPLFWKMISNCVNKSLFCCTKFRFSLCTHTFMPDFKLHNGSRIAGGKPKCKQHGGAQEILYISSCEYRKESHHVYSVSLLKNSCLFFSFTHSRNLKLKLGVQRWDYYCFCCYNIDVDKKIGIRLQKNR